MGVHGLWDLLAPVGRRVSVETLSGKKLAIDASIWMVQFMKAMRDDKGEMVRNAHLLGFFRRICKLLYLRTKPVFVFDGGTPVLKRRTVIARRRQRENAQSKIRKTAEKLLLNQLKAMRLKELAKDLENQRKMNSDGAGRKKGKNAVSDHADRLMSESFQNVEANEMQAPSHSVADARDPKNNASTSAAFTVVEKDSEGEDQVILPANVDPAVLAALPPSLQRDLLSGHRSGVGDKDVDHLVREDFISQNEEHKKMSKGKEILSDISNTARCSLEGDDELADTLDQQKLDEMLAASLAAEEDDLYKNAQRSDALMISDEEGGAEDEAEEMILPVHGTVDPSILAALPPSVQLDLLVQMRERLMAENRQRYQKVKKAPEKFSELQIEAYLKTVAFRREIDEVQKAASGKIVDGVQTSRIASEANREFIFSTSFSGDKQSLASSGPSRRNVDKTHKNTGQPSFHSVDNIASFPTFDSGTEFFTEKTKIAFDEGVETYLDERGRTRVSRLRAMGMRMTRDLQRNLNLIKEIEQEQTPAIQITGAFPSEVPSEVSGSENVNSGSLNSRHEQSMLDVGTSVQISFEVDESKCSGSDDDIFTRLASGQLLELTSDQNEKKDRQLSGSASDSDWEEGVINGKGDKSSKNVCNDSEVEWEEGGYDDPVPAQSEKPIYKGDVEEDADVQEAIRRSLKDLDGRKINHTLFRPEKGETSAAKESSESARFLFRGNNAGGQNKSGGLVQSQTPSETLGAGKPDEAGWTEKMGMAIEKSFETELGCGYPQLCEDAVRGGSLDEEVPCTNSSTNFVEESIPLVVGHSSGGLADKEGTTTSLEISSGDNLPSGLPSSGLSSSDLVNGDRCDKGAEPVKLVVEDEIPVDELMITAKMSNPSISVSDSSRMGSNDGVSTSHNLSSEVNLNSEIGGGRHFMENSAMGYDGSTEANMRQTELEEEMLLLHKEYENLGVEQRKLERNADSVSSEMFSECQELLQMFGLPYIIAPMEAEAQCAYMEISGLVDGIVTDDSDVFLFGARNVYKNIFDERKYVETYFMKDVEKELGLTREKLIRMALLLGSDYTEGVSGVGIVNAVEILNAFSEEDGLQKFREWIESPDPSILGGIGAQNCTDPRKRSSKSGDHCTKSTNCLEEQSVHDEDETKQIFMDKHRNVSKNWQIPATFPSGAVIAAYLSPQVDKSTEPFSWGKPDLHVLQRLCWEKLGWDIHKSNELLLPVLKEYNKHETQLRLEAFYTFNERFAKIRSKRITKAVKSITKNQSINLMDDATEEVSNTRRKRKASNDKSDDDVPERQSNSGKETSSSKKNNSSRKYASTQTRRKKADVLISTEEKKDGHVQGGCMERNRKRSRGNRGGGERGRRTKRGKTKRSSSSQQSDSSSSCDHEGYDDDDPYVENSEHLREPRRSTRLRKRASYVENDLENHDVEPVDLGTRGSDEEVAEQDLSSLQGVERSTPNGLGENVNYEQDLSVWKSSEFNLECQATVGTEKDEDVRPDNSLPVEVDASKEYLKMGGGFCMEESETKEDNDTSSSQQDAGPDFGNSCASGFSEEVQADSPRLQGISSSSTARKELHGHDANDFDSEKSWELAGALETEDASNVIVSLPETNTNSESSSRKALTPMPFLKRKRRKH